MTVMPFGTGYALSTGMYDLVNDVASYPAIYGWLCGG